MVVTVVMIVTVLIVVAVLVMVAVLIVVAILILAVVTVLIVVAVLGMVAVLIVVTVLIVVAILILAVVTVLSLVMRPVIMVTVLIVVAVLGMHCARGNRSKFHLWMHCNLAYSTRPAHDCTANDGRFPPEIHLEHDHLAARNGLAVGVSVAGFILMTVLVLTLVLVLRDGLFINKNEPFSFEGKKTRLWSHAYVIELRLQGE